MAEYELVVQPFSPVYDRSSKVLILGSLPSVKSREQGFYYGHPQNRFWKVLAAVLDEAVPDTIEEKTAMLLGRGIAIWDVIESCDIKGSSDSSVRNARPAAVRSCWRKVPLKESMTTEIWPRNCTIKFRLRGQV